MSDAGTADLLWDNDIDSNGANARAMSPPALPNISVPTGRQFFNRDERSSTG